MTTEVTKTTPTVEIKYRDCKIMYEVDKMTIVDMAAHYGIEWKDMKQVLRNYGFTIRINEPVPTAPTPKYTIKLEEAFVKQKPVNAE